MAPSKTKRNELVARMTAPGTAAGTVVRHLAGRPKMRRLDAAAIARATGEPPRRVAWGLAVLRTFKLLPNAVTAAHLTPAPTTSLARTSLPVPSQCKHSTTVRAAPAPVLAQAAAPVLAQAPTPAAPSAMNVQRIRGPRRQAPKSAVEAAAAWLIDVLAERPQRARVLRARAAEAGIAWRTLQRARVAAGIEARRLGDGVGIWLRSDQVRIVADRS